MTTTYIAALFAHDFQVFIGQYLEFTLNDTLNYGPNDTSTLLDLGFILIISIVSLFLLVIVISVTLLCVGLVCKKIRRKRIRDQPKYVPLKSGMIFWF